MLPTGCIPSGHKFSDYDMCLVCGEYKDKNSNLKLEWVEVLKGLKYKDYWNLVNTIEFISFMTKLVIIIPGLIFGKQWWWLYIFAVITSTFLVWTSNKKTLPTIILFNLIWILLAVTAIAKNFI
jgi:hypothetical protein